jgi:MraZ protein
VFDGFLGSFERSLDDKGRLALPKTFRNQLGESFILSKVTNGHCLGVWTEDEFQSVLERLGEDVRNGRQEQRHMRLFTASAVSVSQDSQGRIIVPGSLREWAGLGRTALVNGASGRIEIWSPERWAQLENLEDEATDDGSWL